MNVTDFEKILAIVTPPVYTFFIAMEMLIGHFRKKIGILGEM
jgi:hypothetical protein